MKIHLIDDNNDTLAEKLTEGIAGDENISEELRQRIKMTLFSLIDHPFLDEESCAAVVKDAAVALGIETEGGGAWMGEDDE